MFHVIKDKVSPQRKFYLIFRLDLYSIWIHFFNYAYLEMLDLDLNLEQTLLDLDSSRSTTSSIMRQFIDTPLPPSNLDLDLGLG